jgi:cytochrome c553
MKRTVSNLIVLLALLSVAALVLTACGGKEAPPSEPQATQAEAEHEHAEGEPAEEHHEGEAEEEEHADEHVHAEIPHEYEGLTNPLAGDAAALEAGKQTYMTLCASCHGESGAGDGPAAAALDPKPTDFTDAAMMGQMDDAYLFWRISEGGAMEPFNSAMPAWKEALSEEQIWQVIIYLRSLSQ